MSQLLNDVRKLLQEERVRVERNFADRIQLVDKLEAGQLSDAEHRELTTQLEFLIERGESHQAELRGLENRVILLEDQEDRRRAAAIASRAEAGVVYVRDEVRTYNRGNAHEHSYFRDLALVSLPEVVLRGTTRDSAEQRLRRHAQELDVELPRRAAETERRARRDIEKAERKSTRGRRTAFEKSPFERRVNPNRTDGQGGYFVPPLYLIEEYIAGLRAGRVAAGLCRQMDLPAGTDSINIPKLSTLTQVGVQGSDNTAVTSQDYSDTVVTANVKTLAGQEDVAIQLLEQSPGQIVDQVVMADLMADYNRLVDRQIIFGNGQNSSSLNGGQVLGIYPQSNWSGTNTVTYTDGSPSGQHFVSVLGAMASQVSWNRFDLDSFHFLLHPRRWFWYATSTDTTGRPLIENPQTGPYNPAALSKANVPAEGWAGTVPFGPNVYIDANVPTTDNGSGGTGGSNDVAIGAKWDDLWLFEGDLRTRVLPEILSGTLQVRFQVYNYLAFLTRYGQSIAIAEGTGFAAPTGAVSSITF